jgi:SAM-dependent methyltransferase
MIDPELIRSFEHAGWERAARSYEASFAAATRLFVPALLDAAAVGSGQRVLDIACGSGVVAAGAADRGAVARGLDFSAGMLNVARARHPGIAFDQGDAEALPYPDNSFDVVVANFGVHHVARPISALQQAHRVLRPGGRLAFTIWGAPAENVAWRLVFDAIRRRGDLSASRAPAPGGGFATPTDCLAALEAAEFTDTGVRKLDGRWRHANGSALLSAMRSGTARMAALIDAQDVNAIPVIISDIDKEALQYRDAEGLAVPIAAFVAYGDKA